jgi:hypothetical protein
VGLAVPTLEQCQKYLGRFHEEPAQTLVALVQSPDVTFAESHVRQDPEVAKRLVAFHWAELLPECVRITLGKWGSAQAKEWARAFYSFLDQEYTMRAFTTEVWILAISTEPLWPNGMSHWDIHQRYGVWWDYRELTVRPLYLAFRVGGTLDSICRVSRIEHDIPIINLVPEMRNIKKEWPKRPATIWHFEPPAKLARPLRTGGGMYNRRGPCDLDLLLSCATVQKVAAAMRQRRPKPETE